VEFFRTNAGRSIGGGRQFNVDREARTFRGMALAFGAPIDCYPPTVFKPGAFTKTLADQGARTRILWGHDQMEPIGRPRWKETAQGLEVLGELDPIPLGDRALIQIESGTLTDLSIGWDPIRWEMVKPEQLSKYGARRDAITKYTAAGEPVRVVLEARLWEVSLVTFGAQPAARIAASLSPETERRMAEVERIIEERREATMRHVEKLAALMTAETELRLRGIIR
jgi:HK97 family phage prohead protease